MRPFQLPNSVALVSCASLGSHVDPERREARVRPASSSSGSCTLHRHQHQLWRQHQLQQQQPEPLIVARRARRDAGHIHSLAAAAAAARQYTLLSPMACQCGRSGGGSGLIIISARSQISAANRTSCIVFAPLIRSLAPQRRLPKGCELVPSGPRATRGRPAAGWLLVRPPDAIRARPPPAAAAFDAAAAAPGANIIAFVAGTCSSQWQQPDSIASASVRSVSVDVK